MLACRGEIAQGKLGAGFEQPGGGVVGKFGLRVAGQHADAGKFACLECDHGVGKCFDAGLLAAAGISAGEGGGGADQAPDDGPGENGEDDHRDDDKERRAQARAHAPSAEGDLDGAGKRDEPGGTERDQKAEREIDDETDH